MEPVAADIGHDGTNERNTDDTGDGGVQRIARAAQAAAEDDLLDLEHNGNDNDVGNIHADGNDLLFFKEYAEDGTAEEEVEDCQKHGDAGTD